VVEGADGIRLATARGGGGESGLLFVHANGFCKEVWNPVIAAIRTEPLSWLSMDLRGHGDSGIGDFPMQWELLGHDVVAVLEGCRGVVGVGHSAGGAAVARAAVASPDTFKHLVPEVEAEYFVSGFNHDTWDIVSSIDMPVIIVAGGRSTTHVEPYLGALVDRFANVDVVVLDDATHLMPMEDPQRVAEVIDAVMSLPSV